MFKYFKLLLLSLIILSLNSCGKDFFKRSDVKDNPVNVDERVQKNIDEGRGIRFGFGKDAKKGGVFDFASSNELWRATVDTLDFAPLTNASYSGGIIITDWFNGNVEGSSNRNLKITVKFLSNEIQSTSLKVDVFERVCNSNNICSTNLLESNIASDIKVAILRRAAYFEKNKIDNIIKENNDKKKVVSGD